MGHRTTDWEAETARHHLWEKQIFKKYTNRKTYWQFEHLTEQKLFLTVDNGKPFTSKSLKEDKQLPFIAQHEKCYLVAPSHVLSKLIFQSVFIFIYALQGMSEISKAYRAYGSDCSDTQIYPRMALNSLGNSSSADETILCFLSSPACLAQPRWGSCAPPAALQGAQWARERWTAARAAGTQPNSHHGDSANNSALHSLAVQIPAPIQGVFKGDHWHFLKKLG